MVFHRRSAPYLYWIPGATGYGGSAIVSELIDAGHHVDHQVGTVPSAQGGESGCGIATTSRPSIPVKSLGLQVYTGRPFATAVAAIMAS